MKKTIGKMAGIYLALILLFTAALWLVSAMYAKDYTRYWHGYLIVLKPLSLFLTYPQIRYLNMFIINILCFLSGMMLYRKTKRTGAACAFILGLTATFLIVAPISFQYMASYTVMFLTVLALLGNLEKRKLRMPELFFGCGMCISFFDFLTFPVVTLGIPLIVSLYPYLWYIAFSNHSQIHYFFTYRAQAVTVFGVLTVLLGLLGDWCQSRRKSL